MDQESFDTLTRTLAAGMSRRAVLHRLSAAGAAGVLAVIGRGTAAAGKCSKANRCGKGKHAQCCTSNEVCCSGTCVPDDQVTVELTPWVNETAPDDHGFCEVTVHVNDFAPDTYEGTVTTVGSVSGIDFTITVEADRQGTQKLDSIYPVGNYSIYARVNGICSLPVRVDCWTT
jgi:hypothetical protein